MTYSKTAMSKRIFISRELEITSPLYRLPNHQISGESLLEFETLDIQVVPDCDWIFFYSQQGVKHFSKQVSADQIKVAAFGPKTAQACKDAGLLVRFVGTGKADQTALALDLVAGGERVLFIRAKNSMRSVQKLAQQVEIFDLPVYDNIPRSNFEIARADILVFTSPLNARTYFSKYAKLAEQEIIAIGPTTAETLIELGMHKVRIPDSASEEAIAELIQIIS